MKTAIEGGDMPMIKVVVETRSIVESGSDAREKMLECAAYLEDQLITNAILDSVFLPSDISLHYAVKMGRPFTAALLLRRGAAVDERDISGATPLIVASKNDNHYMAAILIEWEADVDAKDEVGLTALCYVDRDGENLPLLNFCVKPRKNCATEIDRVR
ncbi:1-alkyl-2-acetylglycerophosphocholine esterase [Penicillium cosmopolitanum]|uniref:1-alkyl-2-acetylglycerophosphocholine esterase n=1 Tax=Penicillium cosmopolitanum TaxID=1131564 RepID=A0A9X0BD71_9EURO|nr:1-alkyl-2-acetylglycerophosphocholine esterase [Penicillium cosmopolitanum]KAJ5408361.1 1-alkyl-2-acetylglycerophosphocholine esterase [Penicillium cosmopolitanum]